jgi:EGF-like domain
MLNHCLHAHAPATAAHANTKRSHAMACAHDQCQCDPLCAMRIHILILPFHYYSLLLAALLCHIQARASGAVHATIAECSNMGSCDRSTGTCTCNAGFEVASSFICSLCSLIGFLLTVHAVPDVMWYSVAAAALRRLMSCNVCTNAAKRCA